MVDYYDIRIEISITFQEIALLRAQTVECNAQLTALVRLGYAHYLADAVHDLRIEIASYRAEMAVLRDHVTFLKHKMNSAA